MSLLVFALINIFRPTTFSLEPQSLERNGQGCRPEVDKVVARAWRCAHAKVLTTAEITDVANAVVIVASSVA